jgi:hypothetical protein
MLLALDETNGFTFYAAPRFHELEEINEAWTLNRVAARSIFVSPQSIGELDNESHHVAYDDNQAWLCSEPKSLHFHHARELLTQIQNQLEEDPRPLRAKLPEIAQKMEIAKIRASDRIREREGTIEEVKEPRSSRMIEAAASLPMRDARTLSEAEQTLRSLSDEAAKTFSAQLIIVQKRPS